MSKKSHIIKVENLKKSYGQLVAVDHVSFKVKKNEVFGILGPNGAGKTTTLEMIEGLKDIDEGVITIDGVNVAQKPTEIKKSIGIQLQSSSYYDHLNVKELLSLFGDFYSRNVDTQKLIDKVKLNGKENAFVKELSGGQKQRLSIASSLVNDPKVLFLDEPTTGLDPQARRNLWDLINEIREDDKTIVLTTHYMEEAEELCDRVAIMDEGEIIALDTPENLINELLDTGFKPKKRVLPATLDDVFLNLTGKALRE